MSFESDLKRMEEITELLKNPETGLECSVELYEEGTKLANKLNKTLSSIERKIEKVTTLDEDEMETVELDDSGNEKKDETSPF